MSFDVKKKKYCIFIRSHHGVPRSDRFRNNIFWNPKYLVKFELECLPLKKQFMFVWNMRFIPFLKQNRNTFIWFIFNSSFSNPSREVFFLSKTRCFCSPLIIIRNYILEIISFLILRNEKQNDGMSTKKHQFDWSNF